MIVKSRWWEPEKYIYIYRIDNTMVLFKYANDPKWKNGKELTPDEIIKHKPFKTEAFEVGKLPKGCRKSHLGRNHRAKVVKRKQMEMI